MGRKHVKSSTMIFTAFMVIFITGGCGGAGNQRSAAPDMAETAISDPYEDAVKSTDETTGMVTTGTGEGSTGITSDTSMEYSGENSGGSIVIGHECIDIDLIPTQE